MKLKKISLLLILNLSFLLYSLFGCVSEQILIPKDRMSEIDFLNPAVSDGFDFPLPAYAPTGNRFLKKNIRSLGCHSSYHPGEDTAGSFGSPIFAASNGIVLFAGYQNEFSGYVVVIEHTAPAGFPFKLPGDKSADKVWSAYYHMSGIDSQNIEHNRIVKRGSRIGFMGDFPSGSRKATHLHFEIRKVNRWKGSAYISLGNKEYTICNKPEEWITGHFVDPSGFIKLNRSQ